VLKTENLVERGENGAEQRIEIASASELGRDAREDRKLAGLTHELGFELLDAVRRIGHRPAMVARS
jgi:hypothetical protein